MLYAVYIFGAETSTFPCDRLTAFAELSAWESWSQHGSWADNKCRMIGITGSGASHSSRVVASCLGELLKMLVAFTYGNYD
jgi:hypothetical protein